MSGLAYSRLPITATPGGTTIATPFRALAKIIVTRPNDVTAYATGDVFGAAVDARLTIPAALRPGARFNFRLTALRHRIPSDASPTLCGILFVGAAPATVIGDNSPLTLSDADIVLLMAAGVLNAQLSVASANGFNWSANPNGRSAATATWAPLAMPAGGDGNLYLYLYHASAYTPIAQEVWDFFPSIFELPG